METCNAVMEQGEKKGQRCWRPIAEHGFCGKHQKQALLTIAKKDNKRKCSTHRCLSLLEENSLEIYCTPCIEKKEEKKKSVTLCIAIIQQHDNKGKQCDKIASIGKYCGKHSERNILVEEATKKGTRICDDGKRSCKNETNDGKLKCEECLEKTRKIEQKEYQMRQLTPDLCLGCGKKMTDITEGFRHDVVKRCKECYIKLKEVEEKRERDERDYNKERKANIIKHYDEYVRGAMKKNLQFNLSAEQFIKLVNSHCHYCDEYDETRVIGIDRVDSNRGYFIENVVGCCSKCNFMKSDLEKEDFLNHICKIYLHSCADTYIVESSPPEEKKSYIRPQKILELYKNKKIKDYIELCKKDERSILFIEKIEKLLNTSLREGECLALIKSALKSDANSIVLTNKNERQRIPRKELLGFLENNKPNDFIKLYESVHGKIDGFDKDVNNLSERWNECNKHIEFNKLLIKYQNKRKNSPGLVE
jgi:hypothetical protein